MLSTVSVVLYNLKSVYHGLKKNFFRLNGSHSGRATHYSCCLEQCESRVMLSGTMETWDSAKAGKYVPNDDDPTFISGDMGKWVVDDTVSSFPECGPTKNYAQISGGVLKLHADESDPDEGCADNIWAALFKGFDGIPINGSKAIPFDSQTVISFDVAGELEHPDRGWVSALSYDSICLSLETKSGIVLDYVFDRHEDRRENSAADYHDLDFWREVFLDMEGGSYTRNLYNDFATIPAFSDGYLTANDLLIHSIGFEVGDTGWGTLDNLRIGETLPGISIHASDPDASESNLDPGRLVISRSGSTDKAVNVTLNIQTGDSNAATEGIDYQTIARSVRIPAGQSSVAVDILPLQDNQAEGDETVTVSITAPSGYMLSGQAEATVTIADDDFPEVSVTASDAFASEGGYNTGQFTIKRLGEALDSLDIYYSLEGTAEKEIDFEYLSGTVHFEIGQRTSVVDVVPIDDQITEPTEFVTLTLIDGDGYDIGASGSSTVYIDDNEIKILYYEVQNSIPIEDSSHIVWITDFPEQAEPIADAISQPGFLVHAVFDFPQGVNPNVICNYHIRGTNLQGQAKTTYLDNNTFRIPTPSTVGEYDLTLSFWTDDPEKGQFMFQKTEHLLYQILDEPETTDKTVTKKELETATRFAAGATRKNNSLKPPYDDALNRIMASIDAANWKYETVAPPHNYMGLITDTVDSGDCNDFSFAMKKIGQILGIGGLSTICDKGRYNNGFLTLNNPALPLESPDEQTGNASNYLYTNTKWDRWYFPSHTFVVYGSTWYDPTFNTSYNGKDDWWNNIDSTIESHDNWEQGELYAVQFIKVDKHGRFQYRLGNIPPEADSENKVSLSEQAQVIYNDLDKNGLYESLTINMTVSGLAGDYLLAGHLRIGQDVISLTETMGAEYHSSTYFTLEGSTSTQTVSIQFSGESIRKIDISNREVIADLYVLDDLGIKQDNTSVAVGTLDSNLFGENNGYLQNLDVVLLNTGSDDTVNSIHVEAETIATSAGELTLVLSIQDAYNTLAFSAEKITPGISSIAAFFDAEVLTYAAPSDYLTVTAELFDGDHSIAYHKDQLSIEDILLPLPKLCNTTYINDRTNNLDSDNLWDELIVDMSVDVLIPDMYEFEAWLYNKNEDLLDIAIVKQNLTKGTNIFSLIFDGGMIGQAEVNGPYSLSYLNIKDSSDTIICSLYNIGETKPYQVTRFENSPGNRIPQTHILAIGVRDEFTNIASDIAAQRLSKAFEYLPGVSSNELIMLNSANSGNYSAIIDAVELAGRIVRPGDTFIFYFGSHGGYNISGDEAPVMTQYNPENLDARIKTTGDETMYLSSVDGSQNVMTDDQFSQLFVGGTWPEVNKLFIMDTCFSGGHIGSTEYGDTGDLSRLNRTGVITAAEEGNFGWARWDWSTNAYINILATGLTNAILDLKNADELTYAMLFEKASVSGSVFDGENGRLITFDPDIQDIWKNDVIIEFNPGFNQSKGFEGAVGEVVELDLPANAPDLTGNLVDVVMPASLVTGQGGSGKIVLAVVNDGTVAVDKGQKIDIRVVARPIAGGPDVHLTTLSNQSISALAPGQSKLFKAKINIPATLTEGDYTLLILVDSLDGLDESDESNNSIASDSATLRVAPPFFDLAGSVLASKLPEHIISGDGAKISLPVVVTNLGNIPIDNAAIDLAIIARPGGGGQDLVIDTIQGLSVSQLKPGADKKVKCNVMLPAGLPTEQYTLVVSIDSGNQVLETNELNNEAISEILSVELGAIDLSGHLEKVTLPSAVIQGTGASGKMQIVVTNLGNVPVAKGQTIDIDLQLRSIDDGQDTPLMTIHDAAISNLKPGKSKKISTSVTITDAIASGDYFLVAKIDSANEVPGEQNQANSEAISHMISIAPPFYDLTAALSNPQLPTRIVSGDGTKITLPVTVTNQGNIPLGDQAIDLAIAIRPNEGGEDIVIDTIQGQSVKNMKPGAAKTINCEALLPAGIPEDLYHLVVLVDSSNLIEEYNELNNEAVSDVMAVEPGEIDLSGQINAITLPKSFVAGQSGRSLAEITIYNTGNVPVAGDSVNPLVKVMFTPVDSNETIEIGSATFAKSILPDSSVTLKVALEPPASLSQNQYQVTVLLDPDNSRTESDESNNILVHPDTWNVTLPPADLILSACNVPGKIYGYERFYVSDTVKNIGGNLKTSTHLAYYLSQDKKLSGDDMELGDRTISPLNSGQSDSGSTRLSTWNMINPFDQPIPYYIIVVVDSYGQVQEGSSGETNNIKSYSVKFMPGDE